MKKINKITIKHIPDDDDDLSYLGTFGNNKGEYGIEHNGERGSYPYFNAENVSNMKEAKQNYETMMKYERGDLYSIGIKAEAEIHTQQDGNSFWKIDKITSGGLWSIEQGYKNDQEDIESIEQEQLEELKLTLKEFGFTDEEINKADIIKDNN